MAKGLTVDVNSGLRRTQLLRMIFWILIAGILIVEIPNLEIMIIEITNIDSQGTKRAATAPLADFTPEVEPRPLRGK